MGFHAYRGLSFISVSVGISFRCTEYSISLLYGICGLDFSGLDLTSVGGLELPIKGGYIFM